MSGDHTGTLAVQIEKLPEGRFYKDQRGNIFRGRSFIVDLSNHVPKITAMIADIIDPHTGGVEKGPMSTNFLKETLSVHFGPYQERNKKD